MDRSLLSKCGRIHDYSWSMIQKPLIWRAVLSFKLNAEDFLHMIHFVISLFSDIVFIVCFCSQISELRWKMSFVKTNCWTNWAVVDHTTCQVVLSTLKDALHLHVCLNFHLINLPSPEDVALPCYTPRVPPCYLCLLSVTRSSLVLNIALAHHFEATRPSLSHCCWSTTFWASGSQSFYGWQYFEYNGGTDYSQTRRC